MKAHCQLNDGVLLQTSVQMPYYLFSNRVAPILSYHPTTKHLVVQNI